MNEQRAQNIIKYRVENGPFKSRDELKKVKAIGSKTFEQCAGFIRIDLSTSKHRGKYNVLDSTWVHPESYDLARKVLITLNLSLNDIGKEAFISRIKLALSEHGTIAKLAAQYHAPDQRVCVSIIQTILIFIRFRIDRFVLN